MHITVNATLLVQMVHFGIAYYLFRVYLLKPALAVRSQEQAVENAALELISRRQQQIEQTVYAQHQLVRSCNAYYSAHKPTVVTHDIVRNVHTAVPEITISSKEKESAVAVATDLIQKTVSERL